MEDSMSNETYHRALPNETSGARPRVGVPWRTAKEEAGGNRLKIEYYYQAIEAAGGEPVPTSLWMSAAELEQLARTLDAIVLPGSPADVDPARYNVKRHPKCADPDPARERTDCALLNHAFAAKKPVLAICYGTQLLNVYLGGTLLQDIASEVPTSIKHDRNGLPAGVDPYHALRIEPGSKLTALARAAEVEINSSHHQAIEKAGESLRVTAHAPDGVVEAVEWTGDANWVVGVQWHPERMKNDRLAEALFRELITAARAGVSGMRK